MGRHGKQGAISGRITMDIISDRVLFKKRQERSSHTDISRNEFRRNKSEGSEAGLSCV